MDITKLKELLEMMKANDLSELEIVDGETRIMLKRGPRERELPPQVITQPVQVPLSQSANTPVFPAETSMAPAGPEQAQQEKLREITSPIVGTFYAAPSPNAKPFVEIGSPVNEDTVVCIIEAMKVMNEIKSEETGVIKKVMVKNGQAVEYGQVLFLVAPE